MKNVSRLICTTPNDTRHRYQKFHNGTMTVQMLPDLTKVEVREERWQGVNNESAVFHF